MSTSTGRLVFPLAVVAACTLLLASVCAVEANEPAKSDAKEVTLVGKVVATYDDADQIDGAYLEVGDDTYDIVLEGEGLKLASADGHRARVTGKLVEDEDGVSWLRVSKFEIVE